MTDDSDQRDITCWTLKPKDGKWYVIQEPNGRSNRHSPIADDAIWHEFQTEIEARAYFVAKSPPTNSQDD